MKGSPFLFYKEIKKYFTFLMGPVMLPAWFNLNNSVKSRECLCIIFQFHFRIVLWHNVRVRKLSSVARIKVVQCWFIFIYNKKIYTRNPNNVSFVFSFCVVFSVFCNYCYRLFLDIWKKNKKSELSWIA